MKSAAPERAVTSGAPSGTPTPGAAKERAAPGFAAPPRGEGAASGSAPAAAAPSALPGRAYEVRRDERGEDVPVIPPGSPGASYRPPPAPPAPPARPGEPVYVRKYSPAVPMQGKDAGGAQNVAPSAQAFAQAPAGDSARIDLCGVVRDPSGRPVAEASVVIAETGASATTDRQGRFCLAAPAGDRTLAVLAVGYAPARQSVHVAAGAAAASVVLQPVQVLSGAASADPVALRSAAFAGLPDSLAAIARRASTFTLGAPALHSATTWEMAADQWSMLVMARPHGTAEDEAVFQLAVARLRAWELSPNEERRQAASQAVETYVVGAQPGARKDLAQSWLARIGP
jgi:peptidoglycan hydrolase-like protein with peptidoglycan-binding domain